MGKALERILIVDDEPALLKMMSAYLGRLGYEVETAGGTEGAWARIQANPGGYAAAVLDATMPGLSLNDLALRALRAAPGLMRSNRADLASRSASSSAAAEPLVCSGSGGIAAEKVPVRVRSNSSSSFRYSRSSGRDCVTVEARASCWRRTGSRSVVASTSSLVR